MNLERAIWGANYLHCDVRSCVVDAHTFGPLCQGWQGLQGLVSNGIPASQELSPSGLGRQCVTGRGRAVMPFCLSAWGLDGGRGGGRGQSRDRPSQTPLVIPGPWVEHSNLSLRGDVVASGKVDRGSVHSTLLRTSRGCVRTAVPSSPHSSTRATHSYGSPRGHVL